MNIIELHVLCIDTYDNTQGDAGDRIHEQTPRYLGPPGHDSVIALKIKFKNLLFT